MKNSIWFKPLSIEDLKDSAVNMDKNLGIEFTEIGDDYIIARMPVIEKTKSFRNIFYEIGNTYVPVLKSNYEAVCNNSFSFCL